MPTMNLVGQNYSDETPDLRAAITQSRIDPTYWSSPAARSVLEHTYEALRPIAINAKADPADALSYAFEVWLGVNDITLADTSTDLWAYTRTAVRRALNHEDEAARKVTSVAGIRRVGSESFERASGSESFEQVYYAQHDLDQPEAETGIADEHRGKRALDALNQILIMAGFDEDNRVLFTDVLADITEASPSNRTSINRLNSVRELFDVPLDEEQWASLVRILLGTDRGLSGILQLAAEGHPAPAAEPHIGHRLLTLMSAVAA